MTTDSNQRTYLVAGGGTAGHIEPALAVADALTTVDPACTVGALGTARGLETSLVPPRGYQLHLIDPVPVPRKVNGALFKLPFRVIRAVRQTIRIIRTENISAVIGFGGYVSAPAYLAARLTGTPFFVHEANARAGLANKLGTWLGGRGLAAVDGSGIKAKVVGIPVRATLTAMNSGATSQEGRSAARKTLGLDPERPVVLITGGSQGAASINRALAEGLNDLLADGIQVVHAYGKKNAEPDAATGYLPRPYIDDMPTAYRAADLIVCRCGAMTVAEVSACGVPAIYIPLPHGNGEQELNARPIVDAGGAVLIKDADLNGSTLVEHVKALLNNPERLQSMRTAVAESDHGSAAITIAELIVAAAAK